MLPALYNHLDAMQWRYATKAYDSSIILDKEILYALQEILRLTPTTMGLQLWRFVLISDREIRKRLVPLCSRLHAGHGEHHIETASHLLVFARPQKFETALIDQHIEHVAYVRNQSIADLHTYSSNLHTWAAHSTESMETWMDHQAYLALGGFVAACAASRIDSCPIENFDKDGFDDVLGLKEKHLHSVVGCSIGKRSQHDKYVHEKKVRYPMEDLFVFL